MKILTKDKSTNEGDILFPDNDKTIDGNSAEAAELLQSFGFSLLRFNDQEAYFIREDTIFIIHNFSLNPKIFIVSCYKDQNIYLHKHQYLLESFRRILTVFTT